MRMRGMLATVLMLLSGATLAAPARSAASPSPASPAPVPFVTVAAGQHSAIITPLQTVIRDQAAWTALWQRHTGDTSIAPPAIDFQTSMVVAMFAGRAPMSTAVAIVRILSEPGRLVVQYRMGERRPISEVGQEVTPFHMVRVKGSAQAVRFLPVKTMPVLPGPGS